MHFDKINNKGQARLFKSDFLESLTKTRPWVIYSIYIPVCFFFIYYSYSILQFSGTFVAMMFLASLGLWTLFEYIAHRYLFHFDAKSKWAQRIIYIFHGNHHEYPRDRNRLFMPPVPSIILAGVVFGIFYLLSLILTGVENYAFLMFPGFMIGYLSYVSMHYAIHAFSPPRFLKPLWRNHHLHHYKYPERAFGVSSIFWDIVFSSLPEKKNGN